MNSNIEINDQLDDKNLLRKKFWKGILLWLFVLLGYFIFVFNWMLMDQMAGTFGGDGWITHFFDSAPSETLTQSINYSITFMRGVGAFFAGWLLVKVGHKYSILISLLLLSVAMVTSFFPWYWLFIIGRMVMAIGGTVLIVYTQPIIANYIY